MTKKLKRFMSALVLVAVIFSLASQVVKASTTAIDDYTFDFDGATGDIYDYSDMQPKTDASSVWVSCDYANTNYTYTATVIGASLYGVYREDITLYTVTVHPGERNVRVYNWVYENDLPFAVLRGEADVDSMYSRSGKWYADWEWN